MGKVFSQLVSPLQIATPGLIVGAIFCFVAALVSDIMGAVANLLMAIVQMFLTFTR
jgi:hypothetical protein